MTPFIYQEMFKNSTIVMTETPGITLNPTTKLLTTENGGIATFTIRLTVEPISNVTIDMTSSDETEGIIYPLSLTFTPN